MIHACRHPQPAAARRVDEDDARGVVEELLRLERRLEDRRGPRVGGARGRLGLIRDELRLDDHADRRLERLDLVHDRRGRTLDERHEPRRTNADRDTRGGPPLHAPTQDTGAEVELALVREQPAVAQVERLVVDEQADDLAVGDVDDRLARLRVSVSRFRLRERAELVERVQVRPRQAERLALVQVRAEPDVPVREREHRLRLREHVEVEVRLAHRPRLHREGGMRDHGRSSSSLRSETTMSAPRSSSASLWPFRPTPTTKPKAPARPAATPARASSNTAAAAGSTPSARAAARNVSGAGLPRRRSRSATTESTRTSNRSPIPAASRTSRQFALEETTAVRSPASRTARVYRIDPSYASTPSRSSSARTSSFLRLPRPLTVSASGGSSRPPSTRGMPREARKERTPS